MNVLHFILCCVVRCDRIYEIFFELGAMRHRGASDERLHFIFECDQLLFNFALNHTADNSFTYVKPSLFEPKESYQIRIPPGMPNTSLAMRIGFLPQVKFPRSPNDNWKYFIKHSPYVWHPITNLTGVENPEQGVNNKLLDLMNTGRVFLLPEGWDKNNHTMRVAIGREVV